MTAQKKAEPSIFSHMLRGASWTVLMRWVIRSVGLLNTIILARLLTPDDFGLVALGVLVIGLLSGLMEGGVDFWLIREQDESRDLVDTVWTCRLIQFAFLAAVVAATTPLAVAHFDEPRLWPVIPLLALGMVAQGATNVGITLARKHLDFALDFRFIVAARLSTFVVTVAAALILRSYWALVIGTVGGAVVELALSYWMHPYRPRFNLSRWRGLVKFAGHMMQMNFARSLSRHMPLFVVGSVASTSTSGLFHVSLSLATMPTAEVLVPVGRALVPTYSKLVGQPAELMRAYLTSVGALYAICLPLGIGLSVTSHLVIPLVLGPKWLDAIPLVAELAIFATIITMSRAATNTILLVVKQEARASFLTWLHLATVGGCIAYGGFVHSVEAIPIAAIVGATINLVLATSIVGVTLKISPVEYLRIVWRPLASVVVMWLLVRWLPLSGLSTPVALAAAVVCGALSYTATLFSLWALEGRPLGPETGLLYLVSKARGKQ